MARRNTATPRTDEFGVPGAHATYLARKAIVRAAVCTAVAVVAALCAAWLLLAAMAVPAVVAVAACVVFGFAARGYWAGVERAMVGARSEKKAAAALRSARPFVVVHGAMLGAGGDLDHAVIGPALVAVETKTGYGKVRSSGGSLVAGRRTLVGDPVRQARRQATALGKRCGQYAHAVVCVVEMENRPFTVDGVTVCSARDLPKVVGSFPGVYAPQQAYAAAARVAK
jgi:hypothetical protein